MHRDFGKFAHTMSVVQDNVLLEGRRMSEVQMSFARTYVHLEKPFYRLSSYYQLS